MDKKIIELALLNISKFGDTDIFPFPIDNHVFFDRKDDVVKYLLNLDKTFDEQLDKFPPVNINTCSSVGYTGFRWVTLIDPIWNAYFLSLVLSISNEIEKERIAISKKVIHSYRFLPDTINGYLFDQNVNWQSFQRESLEIVKSSDYQFVVTCDIADFYNRVYHHKLENALLRLGIKGNAPKRIIEVLQKFSGTNSYGLPIGGPASRILAELSLNNTDKILQLSGIRFTRFVDDIHLFAKTQEEAHANLNFLAMKLMGNEGLTLQKHKTQILSKAEFINLVASRLNADTEDGKTKHRAKFMSLPIRYDPYSPSADEDYKKIKSELQEFDILDLLNEELRKTRIHQQFSKHLLKALNVLDANIVSQAMTAISNRLEMLYPIFPNLMIAAYANFDKLDKPAKNSLITSLQELVKKDSYIIQVELNVAYLIRVLGKEHTSENEELLAQLYKKFSNSILVKSWVMQVFASWKMQFWLSDLKSNFSTMTKWERKIFILASYFMKDEGKHWRDHNKNNFTDYEIIIRDWGTDKIKSTSWEIPL